MKMRNFKSALLGALLLETLAATSAYTCDHSIVISNWKSCAIGPIGMSGNQAGDDAADRKAIPTWSRRMVGDDSLLLANPGLCNEKFHRIVYCLPGWDED